MIEGLIIGAVIGILLGFIIGMLVFSSSQETTNQDNNQNNVYNKESQEEENNIGINDTVEEEQEPVISKVLMKDLNENPEKYEGQTIIVEGIIKRRVGGYSLEESPQNWIWIGNDGWGDDCISREIDYEIASKKYNATGVWTKPQDCSYSCNQPQYFWHLVCEEVIN